MYIVSTKYLARRLKILVRFALRPAVFEIQVWRKSKKSEMHRQNPKWPCTLNGQRYPTYTTHLPPRPIFSSISLYYQPLSRYSTFYNPPIDYHVKRQNKNKKMSFFTFLHISFNLGRDPPPWEYTRIWGNESDMYFQMRFRLKLLIPCGRMLTNTNKQQKNKQKKKKKQLGKSKN